ncbi:MAG: PhnD/SsuA/transferrin family substrate-binding protein [Candidatus Methanoperedens sp.]|nr:PhnD/SsuA/transferrin family substrate-binding protein [Candidatus Methanoperedens sp.]
MADGAAVSSLIYEYMKNTKPDIKSNTRIIEVSPPFGIPPVVVSKDIDPPIRKA